MQSSDPLAASDTTGSKERSASASIVVRPKRGVAYTAEEDETAKSIAEKLNVSVVDLVTLNKRRYPALTRTRRLRHGTVLLIPDTPGALDGNRVIGQKRASCQTNFAMIMLVRCVGD
eukprot:COSAG01_NODE_4213_length_5235_cov_2.565031_4_plen_117_part_00